MAINKLLKKTLIISQLNLMTNKNVQYLSDLRQLKHFMYFLLLQKKSDVKLTLSGSSANDYRKGNALFPV